MNRLQQVFVMRAILDGDFHCDQRGRQLVKSAAELDAIADFRWPWVELKDALLASAQAMRALWRPGAPASTPDVPVITAEVQRAM